MPEYHRIKKFKQGDRILYNLEGNSLEADRQGGTLFSMVISLWNEAQKSEACSLPRWSLEV